MVAMARQRATAEKKRILVGGKMNYYGLQSNQETDLKGIGTILGNLATGTRQYVS